MPLTKTKSKPIALLNKRKENAAILRRSSKENAARKLAEKQKQENKNKHEAVKPVTKPPELQNQLAGIPDNIKLPEWKHKSSERSKETFMFNVNIQDPSKCKLDIFGTGDSGLQQGRNFECNFETIQGDVHLSGVWTVSLHRRQNFIRRNIDIAIFKLHNTKLSFRWVTNEEYLADCLRNVGIELTAENQGERKNESPSENNPVRYLALIKMLQQKGFSLPSNYPTAALSGRSFY